MSALQDALFQGVLRGRVPGSQAKANAEPACLSCCADVDIATVFSYPAAPDTGGPTGGWSPQLGVKTKKQHTAEQQASRHEANRAKLGGSSFVECTEHARPRFTPYMLWPASQMLVLLLLTTMAAASIDGAREFALGACRHFALLLASQWGRQPLPALPPTSKYTSYPVLNGMPANAAALKELHPQAILEAFQEVRPACLPAVALFQGQGWPHWTWFGAHLHLRHD